MKWLLPLPIVLLIPACLLGADKVAPPTTAAAKEAMQSINDVYKKELNAAKTAEQKATLAQKLKDLSVQENDPSARYELLTKARDLAAESGDFHIVSQCIADMAAAYDFDDLKMLKEFAIQTGRVPQTPAQRSELFTGAIGVVEKCLVKDRYDLAIPMSDFAANTAEIAGDPILRKQAAMMLKKVRRAEDAYAQIRDAVARLARTPDDPAANLRVGKFRCFIHGDWEHGLPMLAAGSDAKLKAVAAKELAGASDPAAQAQLADQWWDLLNQLSDTEQQAVQQHAADYYTKAVENITGLEKAKAEKRIAQATQQGLGDTDSVEIASVKWFEKKEISGLATRFPSAKNLVTKNSVEVKASSQYRDRAPERVFDGNRDANSWTLDKENGWFEADWKTPVDGRTLLIISRPSGDDEWGEKSTLTINDGTPIPMAPMGHGKACIITLKQVTAIRKISITFDGHTYPGLSGIEVFKD